MQKDQIDKCFFCGEEDTRLCECFDSIDILFSSGLYGNQPINSPNFDYQGRYFVNPIEYYGEDYLEWEARQLIQKILEEEKE